MQITTCSGAPPTRGPGSSPEAEVARHVLSHAPFLVDLERYSLWPLAFGPSLGSLRSFLLAAQRHPQHRSLVVFEAGQGVFFRLPALLQADLSEEQIVGLFLSSLNQGEPVLAAAVLLGFLVEDLRRVLAETPGRGGSGSGLQVSKISTGSNRHSYMCECGVHGSSVLRWHPTKFASHSPSYLCLFFCVVGGCSSSLCAPWFLLG